MTEPTWIGKTLSGRYEIEELLGQGGMSAVYKATDPNLRRVVAVKLIHPHLSGDAEFVRRFEEEAASVAQLRHPNIIQVYDFNHEGSTYYIVFEFVPGETLQARLKRLHENERFMPLQKVVDVTAGIGDALSYAHQRGLVHRDVKPANVMLNVDNQPVLMDFGIVKIVGGTRHTATGAVMGTARYMSPEQIKGEQVDKRTDIYSLGVMLFEMAGGRVPFNADSAMTVMMMHVNDPVPNVRQLRPQVPPGLVDVVNRALAKDRGDRFQSVAELVDALRAVDLDAPAGATVIETAPSPTPEQTVVETTPPPAQETGAPAATTGAGTGPTTPPPATAPPATTPAPAGGGSGRRRMALIGGGAIVVLLLLACIAGGVFFLPGLLGGDDPDATQEVAEVTETAAPATTATRARTATPDPDEVEVDAAATQESLYAEATHEAMTATAEAAEAATNTPAPTATAAPPTPTSAPTDTPAPTAPPEPYARITGISIDGSNYVVAYETFGYTEQLPGMHVHIYYNTVSEENAGVPGAGPWIAYGGPRPYTGYQVASRPAGATQICIRVANADHSIQFGTGNCVNLPDV